MKGVVWGAHNSWKAQVRNREGELVWESERWYSNAHVALSAAKAKARVMS